MKQLILIIVLLFSTLFNGSLTSAATADYDHNELLDYPGYGEAMYESIVEQTTFISGRYTENKEYVNQSINQITDYANFWLKEKGNLKDACGGTQIFTKNCLGELTSSAGGYALTVGDFIKNLFTDAESSPSLNDAPEIDYGNFICMTKGYTDRFHACDDNMSIKITTPDGNTATRPSFFISVGGAGNDIYNLYISDDPNLYVRSKLTFNPFPLILESREKNDVGPLLRVLTGFGVSYALVNKSTGIPIKNNGSFSPIRDYVVNNSPTVVTPQPKAYLSCPDGTRINMSINGGTFLDVNGKVMQVSKDGTATVDSQICNLGWEKPTVQYIPSDDGSPDKVGVSTPDGKTIDAETGEPIAGEGEIDDSLEGCDGVLCGIGKLLSGLASIAKSIAGLVTKILDGLLALFVPDNLDFVTEEFDKMSVKLTDKFSLLTALKDTITGVFSSGEGGNPLSAVNMSLPAVPGFNFSLDTVTFIEPFVPRIKQIISGILFLMTIIYVYRKITGRGGVMEK